MKGNSVVFNDHIKYFEIQRAQRGSLNSFTPRSYGRKPVQNGINQDQELAAPSTQQSLSLSRGFGGGLGYNCDRSPFLHPRLP